MPTEITPELIQQDLEHLELTEPTIISRMVLRDGEPVRIWKSMDQIPDVIAWLRHEEWDIGDPTPNPPTLKVVPDES